MLAAKVVHYQLLPFSLLLLEWLNQRFPQYPSSSTPITGLEVQSHAEASLLCQAASTYLASADTSNVPSMRLTRLKQVAARAIEAFNRGEILGRSVDEIHAVFWTKWRGEGEYEGWGCERSYERVAGGVCEGVVGICGRAGLRGWRCGGLVVRTASLGSFG
jgi:hypothetical protein